MTVTGVRVAVTPKSDNGPNPKSEHGDGLADSDISIELKKYNIAFCIIVVPLKSLVLMLSTMYVFESWVILSYLFKITLGPTKAVIS